MKTCENCGCAVYNLGCINCDEMAYIEEQDAMTARDYVKLADSSFSHVDDVRGRKLDKLVRGEPAGESK